MSGATKSPGSEAEEERALRENLQVRVLTPEALARMRRATEAEWRAHVGSTPRKIWLSYAAAASVGALAVAAAWVFMSHGWGSRPGEAMARVARAEAPGVLELRPLWSDQHVSVGSDVVSGRTFESLGATLLSLRSGGNLRIAHGSQFEVISANAVRLDSGEMYVDIPKGAHLDSSFVAITNAGEFRHQGTQFALSVANGSTRLRVREGSVVWHAADGDATVEAGSEVVIDRLRHVMRRVIETSGAKWAWTEAMAPEIDIENRPVAEFLGWFARETGRELVVADPLAQRQVAAIHMHGDVHGLEPGQALAAVLGSTSLRFQISGDVIRVSSAGDSPTPSQ